MNELRSCWPYPGTWCSPHVSAGGTPAPSLQTLTNKQTLIRSSVCSVQCGFRVCIIASQFAMWSIHRDATNITHTQMQGSVQALYLRIRFCFLTAFEHKPVIVVFRGIKERNNSQWMPKLQTAQINTNLLGRCFKFLSSGWEQAYFFSVTTLRLHDAAS